MTARYVRVAMRKLTKWIIRFMSSAILVLAVENAGAASINVGSYRNESDDVKRTLLLMYLDGLQNGLQMYGAVLKVQRNEEPLYCPKSRADR